MADKETDTVVRDPAKKTFWTAKNIFYLFLTAALPALAAGIWDKGGRFMENHNDLRSKIEAQQLMLVDLDKRLGDKAVWNALADVRNEQVKTAIQLGVLQALFDREFAKGALVSGPAQTFPLKPPSTTPPPQGAEAPKKPEKSQAELDAEKHEREQLLRLLREAKEGKVYKADLYREQQERDNPQQKINPSQPLPAPNQVPKK